MENLTLRINNPSQLRTCYLDWCQGGGLFIATEQTATLGDEVTVKLDLFDQTEPLVFLGKVVLISPVRSATGAGLGVQLPHDITGKSLQQRIERLLVERIPAAFATASR